MRRWERTELEQQELFRKIEEEIEKSQARYEKDKNSSGWSTSRAEELSSLKSLYECLKNGKNAQELLGELKEELPKLEKWKEEEFESPSFDWYDTHYHYKVLDGRSDAYKIMIGLLENRP